MNLKNIQHKMDRNALRIHNLLNSKIQEQNDLIGKIEKANIDLRQIIEEKNKVIVDLQKEILELTSQQKLIMTEQSELLKQYVIEINEKLNNVELKIETQKNSSRNDTEEVKDSVKKAMNIELEKIENLEQSIQEVKGINKEILWGEIFNNTVSNSDWLTDRSFSPGRWAVGYQYLYSVYRILDIIKPQSILELGLGQSTKLLSQYAKTNPKVNHIVVEHDQDWIDFYKKENEVPKNSKILKLERVTKEYKDDNSVLAFKNFKESLQGLKFDFISIDAPLGANAKVYARIDVLEILPECLDENFVIVIDDYNRNGEKKTVYEIEQILKQNAISYAKGIYSGEKQCIVICPEKLKFICSM